MTCNALQSDVIMTNKGKRTIIPANSGVFHDLANQIKLILRLMADQRVSPLLKLLPIGSLVYLLFPDLVPGPIDDALVVGMGTYMFVELCPPNIVQEHRDALKRVVPGQWNVSPKIDKNKIDESDIVEGEFWEE